MLNQKKKKYIWTVVSKLNVILVLCVSCPRMRNRVYAKEWVATYFS